MKKNVSTIKAYTHIRGKILLGTYAPGSAIKTKPLANELGISRTPVRDALRLLEIDGLVVVNPRTGAKVRSIDIVEFTHLCSLRLGLEAYGAELAAKHITEPELDALRAILAEMEGVIKKLTGEPNKTELVFEYYGLDLRFHLALLTAARNPLIKKECMRIHFLDQVFSGKLINSWPQFQGDQLVREFTASIKEHQRIFHAIEQRDPEAARQATIQSLQPVVDQAMAAMAQTAKQQEAVLKNISMMEQFADALFTAAE